MAQVVLSQLVHGFKFIGQPVHPTLFPFPIAPTVHAAKISLAYQAHARAATASTGAKLPWGTYIAGYLVMTWGGTVLTHHLLNLPPPMLYASTPYILYIGTHLLITLLTHLFPVLLTPAFFAFIDTAFFWLDALVRTGAVTSTTAHLAGVNVAKPLKDSVVTYLIIGALASAGGGLSAATLSTWTSSWSFSTPPVLRAPTLTAFVFGSMDVWGGALVAAVHATLSGKQAFVGVQQVLSPFVGQDAGSAWLSEVEAKAAAAGVLAVCFGLRTYKTYWAGKSGAPVTKAGGARADNAKTKKQ